MVCGLLGINMYLITKLCHTILGKYMGYIGTKVGTEKTYLLWLQQRLTGTNRRRKYILERYTLGTLSCMEQFSKSVPPLQNHLGSTVKLGFLGPILYLLNRNLWWGGRSQEYAFFTSFKSDSNIPKKFAISKKEIQKILMQKWPEVGFRSENNNKNKNNKHQ